MPCQSLPSRLGSPQPARERHRRGAEEGTAVKPTGQRSELRESWELHFTLTLWLFRSFLHCDFLILEERRALCFSLCQHLFHFLASAGFFGGGDRLQDTKMETDMTGHAGSCL